MKRFTFAIALVLTMISPALRADTLRTFSISAPGGSYTNVSGLVVIDTTTGNALYGFADIAINQFSYVGMGGVAPAPQTLHLSGGGIVTNTGCLGGCLEYPNEHGFALGVDDGPAGFFSLHMTAPTSFVDYMGGQMCHGFVCEGDAVSYVVFAAKYPAGVLSDGRPYPAGTIRDIPIYPEATLTYVSQVTTPEPSSLILLGSGALGLVGVFRRKLTVA